MVNTAAAPPLLLALLEPVTVACCDCEKSPPPAPAVRGDFGAFKITGGGDHAAALKGITVFFGTMYTRGVGLLPSATGNAADVFVRGDAACAASAGREAPTTPLLLLVVVVVNAAPTLPTGAWLVDCCEVPR